MLIDHTLQAQAANDTHFRNSKGQTLLMVAACNGYPQLVELLILFRNVNTMTDLRE